MFDYRLGLMCGIDLPLENIPLIIHQPKIKEIALIGEKSFLTGAQYLCIDKQNIQEDNFDLENTNNFQIFMMIMLEKESADKKKSVEDVLTLLFPNYKILFTPRSLIITVDDNQVLIDENNFLDLQNVLNKIFCFDSKKAKQERFNPANKKAQEIARKIQKGRQKVAELKGEDDISIFSQYLSTLTVGLNSMSLEDCMNLTMYQLYDLIERYSLYINWDMDIRTRLAGGKPDDKPDNWMKNIH